MKKKLSEYKLLKKIKSNEDKEISIIENDGKKMILKKILSSDIASINMLKNEFNALYLLQDLDCVPKIIDYSFEENNNYLIMELIKGKQITNLTKLNFKEKILLMIEILNAVEKIHSKGIIHCDLKMSNILLSVDKEIRIIDFGISIYSNNNYFSNYGSMPYCSVQQLLKKDITFDSDLYSLGVIFYRILFNKFPFNGSKDEIVHKKIKCVFEKTNNDLLNFIFLKLFNVNSSLRYKSVREFRNDLKMLLYLFN